MPFRRLWRRSRHAAVAAILPLALACGEPPAPAVEVEFDPSLRPLVSISGVSSGAYLAMQAHVALADKIGTVAAIAGGPYHCAQGSVQTALATCMTGEGLDVEPLIGFAKEFAAAGTIASLENLAGTRVWLFHSPADAVVAPAAGDALQAFYAAFVPDSAIAFVNTIETAHGWATLETGSPCAEMGGDFINACNFDTAGELLRHAYGELGPRQEAQAEHLRSIDVSELFDSDSDVADMAFAYVPADCASDSSLCRLHVSLHGCMQGAEFLDDRFVNQAGLNEWAEGNSIVVVYPQLEKSMFNPNGCWDWWGYTGDDYDQRSGSQVAGIGAIIDAFASGTLLNVHDDT